MSLPTDCLPTDPADWETVVGLEVHAELATATKLFSSAPNQFGGEPNTNIDPVSLGLPGTLPVINEKADIGYGWGARAHTVKYIRS